MSLLPAEIVKKKRESHELSADELRFMIEGYTSGLVPDYQMSAWLMAVYFRGMTNQETAILTDLMLRSGRMLDFSSLPGIAVDKHSTGGIGDKTSMILAPIVAAAGVAVPMIAGRGLGHTGGTLDKLEAIPGFRVDLSLDELTHQVKKIGFAISGQTAEICPADKKIYALRDVTATVESLPLICASIMSKKLAEGIGALVLDVKFGSGAFMKSVDDADRLADHLMAIGRAHGKKVVAFVTSMQQPLGRFIGNALEIGECAAILQNSSYRGRADFADCRDLSLELAGTMIWLGGKASDPESALIHAKEILSSGKAWAMFEKLVAAQGGRWKELPEAGQCFDVLAEQDGFIAAFDGEKIGVAALGLGVGRSKVSDHVDPTAGIEVHAKLGDSIRSGERLYTIYANSHAAPTLFTEAKNRLLSATTISLQKPLVPDLIAKRKVN